MYCLVIGAGDMANALATQFRNFSSGRGHTMKVTSPSVTTNTEFHGTGIPLVPMEGAIAGADLVFLAIPASALAGFVSENLAELADSIVVDVTNSSKTNENLKTIEESLRPMAMPGSKLRWVKGFGDNGAVDLLSRCAVAKHKPSTTMCSNDDDAILVVKDFAEESLGFSVKILPSGDYAEAMGRHQNSLGQHWQYATAIMLFIFTLAEVYAVVRYNVKKGYEWFHLPLQVTNKAFCAAALNGFALAQLPGTIAKLWKVTGTRDPILKFPGWLVTALDIRKHLGIVSLFFLGVHVLMSLIIFNPKYYGKFFIDPKASSSKLNSVGENSFLFATLGFMLYLVVGISSLPCVGQSMNKNQWAFVFGPIVWTALAFGTVHVLIMGVKGWDDVEKWPGGMPPITMTSTLFPMLVMLIKAVEVVAALMKNAGNKRAAAATVGVSG